MADPQAPLDLPPLRDVIARHGLAARKKLGQHFLLDLNLTRKIARAAGDLSGMTVLEIGPGPGGLTRALLETETPRIYAVERDTRCLEALAELEGKSDGRLTVVAADALEYDIHTAEPLPCYIVANLPYNISTPLLLHWLDSLDAVAGMTLMFQKEVADRLTAQPGTKAYGRLSIAAQWRCSVRTLFDLPPTAFVPPPKVTSTVVSLTPLNTPLFPADPDRLFRIVAAAFNQRRKMLRSSLRAVHPDPVALCIRAEVDPTARADNVTIEEYCAIARALADD